MSRPSYRPGRPPPEDSTPWWSRLLVVVGGLASVGIVVALVALAVAAIGRRW